MSYGVCARACVLMCQEFKDMLEEARQASLREEAARASALAAETTRLADAQALAEARELEHRLAVQAALALKARQDEELANA